MLRKHQLQCRQSQQRVVLIRSHMITLLAIKFTQRVLGSTLSRYILITTFYALSALPGTFRACSSPVTSPAAASLTSRCVAGRRRGCPGRRRATAAASAGRSTPRRTTTSASSTSTTTTATTATGGRGRKGHGSPERPPLNTM